MSKSDHLLSLIFDNGTGLSKVGFSNDDTPRVVFPSLVAHPKNEELRFSNVRVGDEALIPNDKYVIEYPIQQGVVVDFDDLEHIWHKTFYEELRAAPEEHPVLLTDTGLTTAKYRQRLSEIMIETFNAPAMYIACQSVLSLYAIGRLSGVVLESGHGITHSVAVYEGFMLHAASHRLELCGATVTDYLKKLLSEHGEAHKFIHNEEVINDIKENHCYVADKTQRDSSLKQSTYTYTLPDGEEIILGDELHRCVEPLFEPALLEDDGAGMHEMTLNTLQQSDEELLELMYQNVQLSGGNTMYPGFAERMEQYFSANVPANVTFKIEAPPRRMFTGWIGGSILASLSSFQSMWLTSKEYFEHGSSVVKHKFY